MLDKDCILIKNYISNPKTYDDFWENAKTLSYQYSSRSKLDFFSWRDAYAIAYAIHFDKTGIKKPEQIEEFMTEDDTTEKKYVRANKLVVPRINLSEYLNKKKQEITA
jgi:hypothetical protein